MTDYPILTALLGELEALRTRQVMAEASRTRLLNGMKQTRCDLPGGLTLWLDDVQARTWHALFTDVMNGRITTEEQLHSRGARVLPPVAIDFLIDWMKRVG